MIGDRARDRRRSRCVSAAIRSTCASANFYGDDGRDTSRPTAWRSRTTSSPSSSPSWSGPRDYRARRAAIAAFNATARSSRGHRADAGQVRHLLHRHPSQPGRRAGARLHRRLDAPEPRRHRDGQGLLHQGRAGGGGGVPGRHRAREDHRDRRPARCPTPRPPRPPPAPTSTAWRRATPRGAIKARLVGSPDRSIGDERLLGTDSVYGTIQVRAYASPSAIRLVYDDTGTFEIRPGDRTIAWHRGAAATDEAMRADLLGRVIAFAAHSDGALGLHASAVCIDGRAIALVGPRASVNRRSRSPLSGRARG